MFIAESVGATVVHCAVGLALLAFIACDRWKKHSGWQRYLAWTCWFALVSMGSSYLCAKDIFDAFRLLSISIFLGGPALFTILGVTSEKRPWRLASFAIVAILVGVGLDAFLLEPHDLQIRREHMNSPKLKQPLKIAVIADLQTDAVGEYERKVLQLVKSEKPDIVLFAGDYVQINDTVGRHRELSKLNALLKEINISPSLGMYAVCGNVEDSLWWHFFKGTGTDCFVNSGTVKRGPIKVTGLTLESSFWTKWKPLPHEVEKDGRFHIVLGHAPDFAMNNPDVDLMVAGHTHGGQVQLPFFGPPLTLSATPREWGRGAFVDGDNDTKLLVSRGVGMERSHAPRLRFLCKPELVFIDVVPASTPARESRSLSPP